MLDSFELSPAVGSGTFGTVFPARAKHHLNARVIAKSHYALKKLSLSSGLSLQMKWVHCIRSKVTLMSLNYWHALLMKKRQQAYRQHILFFLSFKIQPRSKSTFEI